MDRMRGRTMSLVLLFLLLLVTAVATFAFIHNYKESYRSNNLLRIDPLEITGVKTNNPEAELHNSKIWMIGDSRIRSWPEELIHTSFGIANLGVDGQTSSQVFYRFKNYLEADTPTLVILEVGINDLKIIGLDASLTSRITQQYYRNIEEFIQLCRTSNIRLILISIFPPGKIEPLRRLVWNSTVNEVINEANLKLVSFSDDDMIFYFNANAILSDDGMTVKPEYREDFLHINRMGYEALSSKLTIQINNILNQQ